jgi:hypothetical protein
MAWGYKYTDEIVNEWPLICVKKELRAMRTEEEIERRVVFSDVEMTGRFASYVRKIVLEKLSYEAGGELDFVSLSHLMFGIIRVHAFATGFLEDDSLISQLFGRFELLVDMA